MELQKTYHYCKTDVKTGKPLIITNMKTGNRRNVKGWKMDLVDPKDGKPVHLECRFDNSTGKTKASGARAVLEVWK